MGEQGVQERAQNAPLWGPSVEDQRGGYVVAYPHHLGAAPQEDQYPVAPGGVEPQGLALDAELGGYYGVKCRAYSRGTAFSHRYSSCPDGLGQCG